MDDAWDVGDKDDANNSNVIVDKTRDDNFRSNTDIMPIVNRRLFRQKTLNQTDKELDSKITMNLRSKAFQIVKGVVIKKVLDLDEYEVDFNIKRAILMFFIHFLHFFFGFLLAFILILFYGWNFVSNLGFITDDKKILMFAQAGIHFLVISFIL